MTDEQATNESATEKKLRNLVENTVEVEVESRFRQLKWIMAIIGIVGLGTFGTLANYLIEKAVETRLEGRVGKISEQLEFARFYTMSLKLDLSSSFSQSEVDAIMGYLRKVAGNTQIRNSPEFIASLNQVTTSFTAADQSATIDELFAEYQREILSTPGLVEPLLHHYGQRIVGREIEPKDDTAKDAFERLEQVASSSKVPELALAYRTLYETLKASGRQQATVVGLVESSAHLNDVDRNMYWRQILVRSRASNWMHRPTPEGKRIEKVVRSFFKTYSEALESVYGLSQGVAVTLSEQGVDEAGASNLANELASNKSDVSDGG